MKETFYFSHDYNARTDSKIRNLIRKHKLLGYGIYWALIEDLYQNANALPMDCEGIAFDLHTDEKTIQSIIHDFDLFIINDGFFGSLSVQRRLDERNAKSNKAREIAMKRWEKNANALPTQCQGNAIKESKVNDNKVKESKNTVTEHQIFNIPSEEEFLEYGLEQVKSPDFEFSIRAKYTQWVENKWKDGNGKPIKNWKTKLTNTLPYLKAFNPKGKTVQIEAMAKFADQPDKYM